MERFDVIIIGGGHAGAEAAHASARLRAATALITFDLSAIGRMSCNPAIGGIGKGQMVREIDALGGLMGLTADETGIQFRMLNRRKGPALWAPRAQSDRLAYESAVQRRLCACPNLTLIAGSVDDILVSRETHAPNGSPAPVRITGVRLSDGRSLRADALIVTTGTFLRALMHTGPAQQSGGRIGEPSADGLSGALQRLGLRLGRLKTGTPPRIAADSIDYAQLTPQPGDPRPTPFSVMTDALTQDQALCWTTMTNPAVHELIRANLNRAPMFSGQIQSRGPRYCPSIEDKVVRFADKTEHQIFLEPESRSSERIYLNGISTSLPQEVQAQLITQIAGLQQARVLQWGYAVEYDYVPPDQIDAHLMARRVRGLFLAGQINGTSGYEEAAAQGLLAGVNAARLAGGLPGVVLQRDEAYIGVMIDDLLTQELLEPYRMFSSRAEHRLHLRYDNADQRLTPLARRWGLVDDARWQRFQQAQALRTALAERLRAVRLDGRSLAEWLKRPDEDGERFRDLPQFSDLEAGAEIWGSCIVEIKYAGYVDQQRRAIREFRSLEARLIPPEFDYAAVRHLRHEARERLSAARPRSVGQAARVSGVRPTDVSLLLLALQQAASASPADAPSRASP